MTEQNNQDIQLNDAIEAEQVAGDTTLQKRLDWTHENKPELWQEIAQNNDLSHAEIVIMLDDAEVPDLADDSDTDQSDDVGDTADADSTDDVPTTDGETTGSEPSEPLTTEEVQAQPVAEGAASTEEIQAEPVVDGAYETDKVQAGATGEDAKSDGGADDAVAETPEGTDSPDTAVVDGQEEPVVAAGDQERQEKTEAAASGEHTGSNGQPVSDEASEAASDKDGETEVDRSGQSGDTLTNELKPEPSSTDDAVQQQQPNENQDTAAIQAAAESTPEVQVDTPCATGADTGETGDKDPTDPDTVVLVEENADAAAQQGPVVDSGAQQDRNAQDAIDGKTGIQAAMDRTDGSSQVEQPAADSQATAVLNSNKDTPANIPNTDTQMQIKPEGTADNASGDAVAKSVSDAPVQNAQSTIPSPAEATGQSTTADDVTTTDASRTSAAQQSSVVTRMDATLNEYTDVMAANRITSAETGARQQVKLYRALKAVIGAESNSDFVQGMDRFLSHVRDHITGVFHDRYAFRFVSELTLSNTERLEFQHLLRLFTNIATPETRQSALEQTDVDVALKHTPESQRERVKAYVQKIAG